MILADVIKVMEDGDLETVGLEDFKQQLEHSFAAHPKIDPITGQHATYLQIFFPLDK